MTKMASARSEPSARTSRILYCRAAGDPDRTRRGMPLHGRLRVHQGPHLGGYRSPASGPAGAWQALGTADLILCNDQGLLRALFDSQLPDAPDRFSLPLLFETTKSVNAVTAGTNCGRPDLIATVIAATTPAIATKIKKHTATLNCHFSSLMKRGQTRPTARNAL